MPAPYYTDIILVDQTALVVRFFQRAALFSAVIDVDSLEKPLTVTGFKKISEAYDAIQKVARESLCSKASLGKLPELLKTGGIPIVTFDHDVNKYAIVVGSRNGRYEDSGLRFDSQGEAHAALGHSA